MKAKYEIRYFVWFAAILFLLALAVLLLLPVWKEYRNRSGELLRREKEAAALKDELNQRLTETNALENSPEAVEKVAREKFHLVKEGESVLFYPLPQKR